MSTFIYTNTLTNKTGLQPVSRPVERVHYLGGWSGGLFWLGKNLHFAKAQNERSKKCIFGGKKSRISMQTFKTSFGGKKSYILRTLNDKTFEQKF